VARLGSAIKSKIPGLVQDLSDSMVGYKVLPLFLSSPLLPLVQRRIFFGAPLPPLDPAFSFREPAAAVSRP